MSNVFELPIRDRVFPSDLVRLVEDFDYSDFCALLEANTASRVTSINGMTILEYPRAVVICHGDRCTLLRSPGVSLDRLVMQAHERLETEAA